MALIVDTGPLVALLDATDPDHDRCTDLLEQSAEPRMVPVCVLVDATVIAATEMLSEPKVATLDHRHFAVVRPAHTSALTLVP